MDQGYTAAQTAAQDEQIANTQTALGRFVDRYARQGLRDWLDSEGIDEGPGEIIQVNRYLEDPALGSDAYRIPDVSIPDADQIFDATIGTKWPSTPQIKDFSNFSGGSNITIVRPSQLGDLPGEVAGSYSIVP